MRGWRAGRTLSSIHRQRGRRIQIFVGNRNLAAGRADTQRVDHAACVGHMYYRRVDVASRVELAANRRPSKGAGAFDPHVADSHPPRHDCAYSRGAALVYDRGFRRERVEAHYEIAVAVEVENQPQHYLLCGCLLIQIVCAAGEASRLALELCVAQAAQVWDRKHDHETHDHHDDGKLEQRKAARDTRGPARGDDLHPHSPGPTPKRGQKAEQDQQEEGREAARFSVARTHQLLLPSMSAFLPVPPSTPSAPKDLST